MDHRNGNPFQDTEISAIFTSPTGITFDNVYGFYDGNSIYKFDLCQINW